MAHPREGLFVQTAMSARGVKPCRSSRLFMTSCRLICCILCTRLAAAPIDDMEGFTMSTDEEGNDLRPPQAQKHGLKFSFKHEAEGQ